MYTSNLKSKPAWLDYYPNSNKPDVDVNFGFNSTGMWFSGNSGGVSYPIRTNFDIAETTKTEVIFTFIQDNCTDHSVCFFNPSTEPEWSWGTNSTRISFQVDCGGPELEGLNMSGNISGSDLNNGDTYTCKLVYDPQGGTTSYEVYAGTSTLGALINTGSISQILPAGPYRIGFDADQDAFPDKSYFTNLKISGGSTPPYPYPEVIFRVKTYDPLQFVGQNFPDSNINNILLNLQNQTVWIENWPYPLKHGDEFTLYGEKALQTLKAYGQINPTGTQLEVLYYGVKGGYEPTAGSLYFNGIDSKLVINGSNDWALGTGDFTIEWFQKQIPLYNYERVFSIGNFHSASVAGSMETGANTFYLWFGGEGTANGPIDPYFNTWTHVAITRESGTMRIFFNGALNNGYTDTTDITDNTTPLYIGCEQNGAPYKGYLNDFHWVKGTALYTSNFTPPTQPITPVANTKLLLKALTTDAVVIDTSVFGKSIANTNVTSSDESPF